MTKDKRATLNAYTDAARNLELVETAINILERVNTTEARNVVKTLKRSQQRQLRLLDAAAAALGAPYPGTS